MPDQLEIAPRMDTLVSICRDLAQRANRKDDNLAPLWAEKLRHTYTKIFEIEFPQYAAAAGEVLPIDTSMNPAATQWEYFVLEQRGYADWIDDDGRIMPSGSVTAKRETGEAHEMGHKYDVTMADLERAAFAGVPLPTYKQENARRTIDAKTNWSWLFGSDEKGLPGLVNHPNITVTVAPIDGTAAGRAIENKTVDEILTDVETLIDTVAEQTIRQHFVAKVFMPHADVNHLKSRRLGAGDGFMTAWDFMVNRYSGDETGQPAVKFMVLNECTAANRLEPVSGTDTSGITGRFWLALPPDNKDNLAFLRARPITQLPPQETDMVLSHIVHSKIGGCKCQIPLAVHRLDFLE